MAAARKRVMQSTRPSACEERGVRSSEIRPALKRQPTLVGYRRADEEPEDPTAVTAYERVLDRVPAPAAPETEGATVVERYRASSDTTALSSDKLEQLKQKLREAEEREESGIRDTPQKPWLRARAEEALEAIDIEVDAPRTLEEWNEGMSALPEIEVALAPNSESNFYGGFDEENPDGVFVATYDNEHEIGTPMYAIVHLPAGYRFRSLAVVEFTRSAEAASESAPAGVGLRLCGLDLRMRRLITAFAKHRKPLFYVG